MKIRYLDGKRLKQGIIAGARRVIQMQENLNRINVFPVPDSDTGTNMALTLQNVAEGVISCHDRSISVVSQCVAESALMGARGNSGAILAQFFQGLAESFSGKIKITAKHFAEAVEKARQYAYEAITEPREGTILTVIHDWAEHIKTQCVKRPDFFHLLQDGLKAARRSLSETPTKLKLLARAGVVDAGAQGFVNMLEGIWNYLESGKIERMVGVDGQKRSEKARVENAPQNITFQFCTECLVIGERVDRGKLREEVRNLGDSLIVAGSNKKVRIHVHTNEPQRVFQIASKYGNVTYTKYDDMRRQHSAAYGETKVADIALVTDTSCDLPPEFVIRHSIQMVPLQICFGHERYIDKITITPKEFYYLLENSTYPTTSQPSPADYRKVYDILKNHYQHVVSIHLSGALSGTLQAAKTAANYIEGTEVHVIDSKNASVALGLIVAEAAQAIEERGKIDEVLDRVQWAIQNVRLFVSIDTMEYLIRGGRVSRSRGLLAKLLNLRPILTIDTEGRAQTIAKIFGGQKTRLKKTLELVCKEAMGKRKLRFAVGHANVPQLAGWVAQQIKRQFELKDVMLVNVSPALGAHAGPGAIGIAFLGE